MTFSILCQLFTQGILKGEVSLYNWPPVWLIWNQLYDNWQFLFLFAKKTNPNQLNRRTMVQWYFPVEYSLIYHTDLHHHRRQSTQLNGDGYGPCPGLHLYNAAYGRSLSRKDRRHQHVLRRAQPLVQHRPDRRSHAWSELVICELIVILSCRKFK